MLQSLETVYLLTALPSDVYVPIAVAGVSTASVLCKAIHVLYVNNQALHEAATKERTENIGVFKDMTHALEKLTESNRAALDTAEKLYEEIREDRRRRASSG